MDISVVIVAYNAEEYLRVCLSSIAWANEIVLIDLGSQDRTLEIARTFNCRIMKHAWVPIAEFVRHEAIEACKNEWVLVLDPDEVVPLSLAGQLGRIASENDVDAVSIPWKNFIFGHWMQHSGWEDDRHMRFFRKGAVTYYAQAHRSEITKGRTLQLPPEEGNFIEHQNYENVTQFVEKLNRYTSLEAEHLLGQPDDVLVSDLARQHFNTMRSRFFRSRGYKDGLQGFAACELMAAYSTVTHVKAMEKKGWPKYDSQALLSLTRQGILLGMWDLLLGMEETAEHISLRVSYRLLRGAVSLVLRLRAF